MKTNHYSVWLFAAIFCAGLSSWYAVKKSSSIVFEDSKQSSVDAIVSDLTFKQFDKNGLESQSLYTPLAKRIPAAKKHILNNPHILFKEDSQLVWDISSDIATAFLSGKKIVFKNHVILSRKDGNAENLKIRSNIAIFNKIKHEAICKGEVLIDQDDAHIQANIVKTKTNVDNKLQNLYLFGSSSKQVHYSSKVINKPEINAYADIIKYFPEKHLMQLIGNAVLKQGNDSFSSPIITYDTLSKHVISSSKGIVRTKIVIHPENYT